MEVEISIYWVLCVATLQFNIKWAALYAQCEECFSCKGEVRLLSNVFDDVLFSFNHLAFFELNDCVDPRIKDVGYAKIGASCLFPVGFKVVRNTFELNQYIVVKLDVYILGPAIHYLHVRICRDRHCISIR